MDAFLGIVAALLGFSDKKETSKIIVKRRKTLDEEIDEHFYPEKINRK